MNILQAEIKAAIDSLKNGKATGPDGLSSEHFKFGANRLIVVLSIVLSCIVSHGFIPPSFMKYIIIPLIKDKSGDITNNNNYMPIAIIYCII